MPDPASLNRFGLPHTNVKYSPGLVIVATAVFTGLWFSARSCGVPQPQQAAPEKSSSSALGRPPNVTAEAPVAEVPTFAKDTNEFVRSRQDLYTARESHIIEGGDAQSAVKFGEDCDCPTLVLHDIRRCVKHLGAMLKPGFRIDAHMCHKLDAIYKRYRHLERALEKSRMSLLIRNARKRFLAGRTEVYFEDHIWNNVCRKPGEDIRLRTLGFKPRSEAPVISTQNEHQSWHFVDGPSDMLPKSPYYPAVHLVRFQFGEEPELDQPLARVRELEKERAILYSSIIPSQLQPR